MALDNKSHEYEAFLGAVKNGRTAEVEQHLTEHPEFLDLANDHEAMPLHWAAHNGRDSTAELLLNRGSTALDFPNKFGWTPLHFAAMNGRDSTMTILKAVGDIILPLDYLNQEKIAKLQAPIPDEEILEIRDRIYFSRSLLSALL